VTLSGEEIRRRFEGEGGSPFPWRCSALDLLERFAGEVGRWGQRTHLVGKSNIEGNIMISLLDSLHLLRFAECSGDLESADGSRRTVADIGSGAGFPGIVWVIARPDIDMTLFERREKPQLFLGRTTRLLGLDGTVVVGGEAGGGEGAGRFDLVVSKAAGRLDMMIPIAGELLREGGAYLTIKGEGWKGEMPQETESRISFVSEERLPGDRGSMLRLQRART
jgi:16S rRNA (guanine(527)-N(7))-methyltransferase RsmG